MYNKTIKMNKKIIFVFFVVSLFLIAGCTGGSDKSPITDVDVRKGTDGLIMEFTKNAPPQRVFEDSVFPIAINLKNRGASDIKATDTDIKEGEGIIRTVEGKLIFGFETTFVGVVGKIKDEIKKLSDEEKNVLSEEGVII